MDDSRTTNMYYISAQVPRVLILIAAALSLWYLTWWFDFSRAGSITLFVLLFIGEIYHVWQSLGFLHTVWDMKKVEHKVSVTNPLVDIFITVCGEPVDIVEQTVRGALAINYPNFTVHILNDGKVARKENWEEIITLGKSLGVNVITREIPGGAKAGNINHALKLTSAPFFALFDADHVPHPEFLERTMGHLEDPKMAIVQSPQYYINKGENFLTRASWEQQELFFGPICIGKNRHNATFWCGTNAVVRRTAIESIGGVPEDNIAEDFCASLFIHQRGWKTLFIPEILAKGLGPTDLKSFFNQQFRWARGSLELVFRYNPFFRKGLTFAQRSQYLYSAGYYLSGLIILIDAVVPLVVLLTGIRPVEDSTGNFIIYFFPFIFITLYVLMRATNYSITFRAVQLSMSSFFIFILAAISTITGKKSAFKVTDKRAAQGNYLMYALPNIIYTVATVLIIAFALYMHGPTPHVITNAAWAIFNVVFFFPFIVVAYPWRTEANHLLEKANHRINSTTFGKYVNTHTMIMLNSVKKLW